MRRYQIKRVKMFLMYLLTYLPSIACGQNILGYESTITNLEIILEIPSLSNFNRKKEIEQNVKIFLNKRAAEYEQFLTKNQAAKIPVLLYFHIDSVYTYKNYAILVYKVREENIPIYNLSHWIETLVFDTQSGRQEILNICDFLNCNSPIPLHKIVNNRTQSIACKLIEDDNFHIKHFVPKPDGKFIVFVWSQLGRDPEKCKSSYETMQMEFNKEDLLKLIGNETPIRYIQSSKSYLYSSADAPFKTNTYLIKGDKIEVLSEQNDWVKIRFRGKRLVEGWIKKNDIGLVKPLI